MKVDDTPATRVRDRMKDWLQVTGISQQEFVEELQKTQPWLAAILKGKNDVRLADLDIIAQAMRTTASELVRTSDERYQLELSPTEVRIMERLRHRPEMYGAIATLLRVSLAQIDAQQKKRRDKSV